MCENTVLSAKELNDRLEAEGDLTATLVSVTEAEDGDDESEETTSTLRVRTEDGQEYDIPSTHFGSGAFVTQVDQKVTLHYADDGTDVPDISGQVPFLYAFFGREIYKS